MFQFTHPGRGATRGNRLYFRKSELVSIHAPREGCDYVVDKLCDESNMFQFTHPGRGATGAKIVTAVRS